MSGGKGRNMMTTDGTGHVGPKGTVVFDLDGVVYLGDAGVPGSAEALTAITEMGWHLVFATNNSTKTRQTVLEHVAQRTGFLGTGADVVTSGMAAAAWALRDHQRVYVVGEQGLRDTLTDAGLEIVTADHAEAVIVGLDRDIDYEAIAIAARLVRNGATYIATNTDATLPTQSGPVPGAGSIVAAITAASGCQPTSCGKPETPMIEMIRARIKGDRVWVVGDRPETDLAMARRSGWEAVLVLTGVTDRGVAISAENAPDHTVESIASVPGLISAQDSERRRDGG